MGSGTAVANYGDRIVPGDTMLNLIIYSQISEISIKPQCPKICPCFLLESHAGGFFGTKNQTVPTKIIITTSLEKKRRINLRNRMIIIIHTMVVNSESPSLKPFCQLEVKEEHMLILHKQRTILSFHWRDEGEECVQCVSWWWDKLDLGAYQSYRQRSHLQQRMGGTKLSIGSCASNNLKLSLKWNDETEGQLTKLRGGYRCKWHKHVQPVYQSLDSPVQDIQNVTYPLSDFDQDDTTQGKT